MTNKPLCIFSVLLLCLAVSLVCFCVCACIFSFVSVYIYIYVCIIPVSVCHLICLSLHAVCVHISQSQSVCVCAHTLVCQAICSLSGLVLSPRALSSSQCSGIKKTDMYHNSFSDVLSPIPTVY